MPILITENNLGLVLKDARKRLGLTQAQAGESVGLSQVVISRVEAGKHALKIDTLFKLLAALKLELLLQPKEHHDENDRGDQW